MITECRATEKRTSKGRERTICGAPGRPPGSWALRRQREERETETEDGKRVKLVAVVEKGKLRDKVKEQAPHIAMEEG